MGFPLRGGFYYLFATDFPSFTQEHTNTMTETLDTIVTDMIYEHERYGEVLVVGIGQMYDEYHLDKTSDESATPDPHSTIVYFYKQFDGYGGMSPTPLTEPVTEFAAESSVGRLHTDGKQNFYNSRNRM
jgi:hypothetical protein